MHFPADASFSCHRNFNQRKTNTIIILKQNANPEKVEILKQELEHKGFKLHLSQGTQTSLIGLIGDTSDP